MLQMILSKDRAEQVAGYTARIRKLFVFVALALMVIVVALEVGMPSILPAQVPKAAGDFDWAAIEESAGDLLPPEVLVLMRSNSDAKKALATPDKQHLPWAVRSLAFVDAVTLLTILLIAASQFVPAATMAKVQGAITLLFAILLLVAAVVFVIPVIAQLYVMLGLLFAVPFGTLIYVFTYGSFDRGSAMMLLPWLFSMKVAFGISLVVNSERYLENAGLVLAVLSTMLASIVVSLLYGLVPGILLSVADAIAAILIVALAVVWIIALAAGAILSLVLLLRSVVSLPQ